MLRRVQYDVLLIFYQSIHCVITSFPYFCPFLIFSFK